MSVFKPTKNKVPSKVHFSEYLKTEDQPNQTEPTEPATPEKPETK